MLVVVSMILASGPAFAQAGGPVAIVHGTPLWVWALFAFLVVTGLQALRPRELPLARVLIIPVAFISWGIASLLATREAMPIAVLDWLLAAAVGAALALATVQDGGFRVAAGRARVALPGSPLPLLRNLAIFAAKYGLAVAAILYPRAAGQLQLWSIAVSGASAGYFLGWLGRLAASWRRAARLDRKLPAAGAAR
jgi:hypothetical protein